MNLHCVASSWVFQASRDVVRVAAGAVRLFALHRDRLQLCEVQRQVHLSGLAETGTRRTPHHQMGELPNRNFS